MEQKLFIILSHPNKNWWGQRKCKKVSGTKIGGWNKKKVSGTKIGERNKNSRTKIGGQNKKKVSGTKIGEQSKRKVSGTKIGERNKNVRTKTVEQKLFIILSHPNKNWWGQCKFKKVSRTKIGGHCWPLGDGDPKSKCKKVSRTKIAEQK